MSLTRLRHLHHCYSTAIVYFCFFFFNDTPTTEIYTLSLHDALPIFTETHQSPIWLKADGERPSLRPLAFIQPQKIFGTRPCPRVRVTDLWFPVSSTGQTLAGSRPGRFRSHSSDSTCKVGWDSYQSHLVVVNQPHLLVPCPSHP